MNNVVFLEFFNSLPPRHILFKDLMEGMGYRVTPVFWDRVNAYSQTNGQEYFVYRTAKVRSPLLLLALPALWRGQWAWLRVVNPEWILVGHLFLIPIAIVWRFFRGWRQTRIIYDVIEQFPRNISRYFGPFHVLSYPLLMFCENLGACLSSSVLVVDSRGGKLEKRLSRWNPRTRVIWNLPSKNDDPATVEVESVKNQYVGRSVVAYAGAIMNDKGLNVTLEAASRVRECHPEVMFLFIGPMKEQTAFVQDRINRMKLEQHVRFMKPMPYRELQAHLRHGLIGLALYQPARSYAHLSIGNGRKFFTYMQAGIAIIGPDFGEIGQSVRKTNCGILINSVDCIAVADAIIELLDDSNRALELGRNGREAFENFFNWEREKGKFEDLIRMTSV